MGMRLHSIFVNDRQYQSALILAVICLLMATPTVASAQNKGFISEANRFSFSIDFAVATNFMSGEMGKSVGLIIDDLKNAGDDNDLFSGKKQIKMAPMFGIYADYLFRKSISFRAGFRLAKRGYQMRLDGNVKDNEYQLDHQFQYEEKFNLWALEIPMATSLKINRTISLNGGLLVGLGFKGSAKRQASICQQTILNGAKTESDRSEEILNVPDNVNSNYLGAFVGVEYQIYPRLNIGISGQKVMNYARFEDNRLSDNTLSLAIRYDLSLLTLFKK